MGDSTKLSDEDLMKRIAQNQKQSDSYKDVSNEELMKRITAQQSAKTDSERPAAALVESAGDMLTAGYSSNLKAGIAEGFGKLGANRAKVLATLDRPISEVISGKAYENLPELNSYAETRDYASKKSNELKDANPAASLVGTVGGALLPIGAAATSLKGLKGGAKALALLKNVGKGAATAAVFNPGDVEGEVTPLQVKERAQNFALGGGLSAILGVGGIAAEKAAPKVKALANSMAARALGRGTQSIKGKIGDKGLQEMGETALKEGVIGYIPRGIKKINDRVVALVKKAGEQIGSVMDDIDEVENAARKSGFTVGVSKSKVADKVKSEVLGEFDDPQYVKQVGRRLSRFINSGKDDVIPTKALHKLKVEQGMRMDKRGVWERAKNRSLTTDDRFELALYDAMSEAVLDASSGVAKISNKPGLAKKIETANQLFSRSKNMQKITNKELNASNTNNLIGLISAATGIGEGVRSGSWERGLAAAAGIQALKRGGPQIAAKALDASSKLLGKAGQIPISGKVIGQLSAAKMKEKRENAIERRLKREE